MKINSDFISKELSLSKNVYGFFKHWSVMWSRLRLINLLLYLFIKWCNPKDTWYLYYHFYFFANQVLLDGKASNLNFSVKGDLTWASLKVLPIRGREKNDSLQRKVVNNANEQGLWTRWYNSDFEFHERRFREWEIVERVNEWIMLK